MAAAPPRGAPPRQIQTPPCRRQRIRPDVRLDQRLVAGMQPLQQGRVAGSEVPRRRARMTARRYGRRTRRSRRRAASRDAARAGRSHFPRHSPGRTGRHETGRPHRGRRAGYTCRSPRRPGSSIASPPFTRRAAPARRAVPAASGRSLPSAEVGIAQDRRVVGERRHGADVGRAVGDLAQRLPAQPAGATSVRCSAARHRARRRHACRHSRWQRSPGSAGGGPA